MRLSLQKQVIFLIAALFCISGAAVASSADSAAKSQAKPGSTDQPAIKISETTYNFGQILEGNVAKHDFPVRNTGTAVLKINRVRTD